VQSGEVHMPTLLVRAYRPAWFGRPLLARFLLYALMLALVSWSFARSPALFGWLGGRTAPGHSIRSALFFGVFVSGVTIWSWRRKTTLVIASAGVSCDMPGIGVDVLWEEVAGTAAWRGRRPWQRGDGLLLRDVRWEMLGAQAHNPADASLQGRVIPLDLFDARWRARAIGDDIRRYAPHLMRDEEGTDQ